MNKEVKNLIRRVARKSGYDESGLVLLSIFYFIYEEDKRGIYPWTKKERDRAERLLIARNVNKQRG